jgi:hypothetical protein
MTKIEALAKHLETEVDNLKENDDCNFEDGGNSYMVLTDEEADDKAKEYIIDSLWAFNASFLASHCDLDQDVIESIQANEKCESNNPVFKKLINDLDHFVSDAISADGRAHFLHTYDGEENEVGEFFIYRT